MASKKKIILSLVVVCFAFVLSGCISTKAVKMSTTPNRPPLPPELVSIYRTAEQVPGEYEEIALITSRGDSLWTNENKMYEKMKKKAGQMGANAIILDAMSEPKDGTKIVAMLLWGGGANRRGKAIAIFVFEK